VSSLTALTSGVDKGLRSLRSRPRGATRRFEQRSKLAVPYPSTCRIYCDVCRAACGVGAAQHLRLRNARRNAEFSRLPAEAVARHPEPAGVRPLGGTQHRTIACERGLMRCPGCSKFGIFLEGRVALAPRARGPRRPARRSSGPWWRRTPRHSRAPPLHLPPRATAPARRGTAAAPWRAPAPRPPPASPPSPMCCGMRCQYTVCCSTSSWTVWGGGHRIDVGCQYTVCWSTSSWTIWGGGHRFVVGCQYTVSCAVVPMGRGLLSCIGSHACIAWPCQIE
jgi:hypothetical protein